MGDVSVINVDPSTPPATKKPSYTSQFSSESSGILTRLKSGSRTVQNRSVEGTVVAGLGDTLPIPAPANSQNQSTVVSSLNAGVKRKREESLEKVDFTQSTIPLSWKGHAPTQQANREQTVKLRSKVSQQRQHEIDSLRQKRLSALPKGVVPAKPGLVGFGAGRASDSSRAEYFDSMPKTDLLNVLSLCNQLKPNLLVDVLVSVSKRHPDLPIFDSPDWESQLLNRSRPVKASRHDERPRHGHVLLNKMKHKQKTTKKILKRTRVIEVITSAPEEDNVDVLPPTWAKADRGLYSKLPPEAEDRILLVDENDEESFSHFLVDGAGRQIMEPVGA
ncbi:hypothetical protein F66182_6117 [Fusarium sp. NRRL 66182]|nr:hypothetical protein F66182_6117 [Fusarium sp. NRRL 66182]